MRLRVLGAAAVVAAAILAAGCGGNDQPSTSEWADGLCSAITTWTSSLSSIASTLQSGGLNKDSLTSAADDAKSSTDEFTSTLDDLGKPDIESGQQAQDAVDQLSSEIKAYIETIQNAVNDASGVSGILSAVTVIKDTITKAGTQVSSTITSLKDIDAKGELESAFTNASSCQNLSSGGS